ncbi:peptide ABC transporter substrate-binding protein [Alicyclobacillus mengziensis]|uniref:Peptide ABC transporter substrate-binding protein n=1 Tax=Alicyclobacillus mengziensis TaxID=2931921 RepID=A0A9X7VYU1_9BACL|nr:peptide ABC transporter substrate-binding protein [Alicyclobacillus mengziensis]QSO47290.1 peptide ABC transporter substrate-binding protein [Alicyclobacillus mengziensis]
MFRGKRLRRTRIGVAAASVGLMVVVAGCGSPHSTNTANSTSTGHSTGTNTTGQSSNSKPTPGGTLVYALAPQSNLNWFIPVVNSAADSVANFQLIFQLYKPLLWVNANYSINWQSSIASKITYNKQGTVYHLYLNPKWHWSNGQPVTSQDVLFTWHVIQAASSANAPAPWPYVGEGTGDIPNGIKSVVANGPYELTFTLKKPANQQWFILNGLIQLVPMPAKAWDIHKNIMNEIKYLGTHATNPMFDTVVDGPFKMAKAQSDQYWQLVPNTSYDGHKSILNKLVFQYEGSNSAEFAALKTGSVNVGYLDLSEWASRQSLTSQGDVITPEYMFGYFETQLNMFKGSPVRSILDKLYVRQALQMGIDRKSINTDIFHGFAPPIDGPIPGTPKTNFLSPSLAAKNPYPYNPTAGKKLLEAHGWHLVNGVMTKGSQQMKFTLAFPSGTIAETDQVELMKQDWGLEGIDITLKPLPATTLESITYTPSDASQWDLSTGLAWFYNGPGYWPTGGQLFASNAPSGFGYTNSTEDALIAATHQPYPTQQASMQAFYRYEDFTAKHLPVLWQNTQATLAVHAPNVHDSVKYADASVGFPQMQYWWISQPSS